MVVHRRVWTGARHTQLYAQIKALAELWQPRRIIIDATSVGAGLASFLAQAFPSEVIPFLFTQRSKSDLGWKFLSIIESGRYLEYFSASSISARWRFCPARINCCAGAYRMARNPAVETTPTNYETHLRGFILKSPKGDFVRQLKYLYFSCEFVAANLFAQ